MRALRLFGFIALLSAVTVIAFLIGCFLVLAIVDRWG